jgi:choline dehydrogenase-like flavoprotein
MLIDARSLPPDEQIESDVCIVGAGPAGITLALELLGTGARICILESGGKEPGEMRSGLVGGGSVGYPYFSLKHVNRRALGGTSHAWELWHACPLDRIDFEGRPGVSGPGWPFERSALVPFYRRAEEIVGAEPFDYADSPEKDESLAARLPVEAGSVVVRWIQILRNRFREHTDLLAQSDAVRILLHAVTSEIVVEPGSDEVNSVRAMTAPGRSLSVRARLYVLAAGGIETPRLLLLSNRVRERGIGNEHDAVGRYFMEHPSARSGVIVPASPAVLADRSLYFTPGTLYPDVKASGRVSHRPVVTLDERVLRRKGLLNVAFLLEAQTRAFAGSGTRSLGILGRALTARPRVPHLARHGFAVARDAMSVSSTALSKVTRRPTTPSVLVMRVQGEQEPQPDSRVALGSRRDEYGRRFAQLDWQLSKLDAGSIRRAQDVVDDQLRGAGLGTVEDKLGTEYAPVLFYGLYHHLGTTRMHDDPKQGVVDADCRVHSTSNLFVTGGSVFPTSGWANPTLTVVALASKLADHLKQSHGLS